MPLKDMMKRIKINKYYILDEACYASLKEYQPVKVKTMKKLPHGEFLVMPIEPVVYPVTEDGWAVRPFIVHKRFLTPTTFDEKIVIRCPLNMPKFSRNDELALTAIYDALSGQTGGVVSHQDVLRLKAVIHKIRYVQAFNEVNL